MRSGWAGLLRGPPVISGMHGWALLSAYSLAAALAGAGTATAAALPLLSVRCAVCKEHSHRCEPLGNSPAPKIISTSVNYLESWRRAEQRRAGPPRSSLAALCAGRAQHRWCTGLGGAAQVQDRRLARRRNRLDGCSSDRDKDWRQRRKRKALLESWREGHKERRYGHTRGTLLKSLSDRRTDRRLVQGRKRLLNSLSDGREDRRLVQRRSTLVNCLPDGHKDRRLGRQRKRLLKSFSGVRQDRRWGRKRSRGGKLQFREVLGIAVRAVRQRQWCSFLARALNTRRARVTCRQPVHSLAVLVHMKCRALQWCSLLSIHAASDRLSSGLCSRVRWVQTCIWSVTSGQHKKFWCSSILRPNFLIC